MSGGALMWYDDDSIRQIVDLEAIPVNDDYLTAYDAAADGFYMMNPADITVGTATLASTVTVTDNDDTSETNAVLFAAGAAGSGSLGVEADRTGGTLFTYDPATGTVEATEFVGGGVGITGLTATPGWGAIEGKTVSGGEITTGGDAFMAITEEGDAADAVTQIDGAAVGDVLVLKGVAALNNTITFTDDDSDLDLQADFLMDNENDTLVLICIGTGTPDTFIEVSRASNG
jgi:hypothetical protein